MGEASAKKRKRAEVETEDGETTLPQRPHKSRVTELGGLEVASVDKSVAGKIAKDGKSRQEKSERRAKNPKKDKFAASATESTNEHTNIARPDRKPKKQKRSTEDTPDAVGVDEAGPAQLLTNGDSVLTTNGTQKERSHKSFRKDVTATETLEGGADESVLAPASMNGDSTLVVNGVAKKHSKQKPAAEAVSEDAPTVDPKNQRFILFIGNLPYSATTPQIQSHFIKLAPTSIRHSTDKSTGRSKGFAFLEFDGYDKMKTCLSLYHHSMFDPQEGPKAQQDKSKQKKGQVGRRINVELTVGGGGAKSEKRKEKLKGKNVRLEEQRERKRVKELEDGEKEEIEKEEKKKRKARAPATDANATVQVEKEKELDMGAIHPSRRTRVG